MRRIEVTGVVRQIQWSLGVKWLTAALFKHYSQATPEAVITAVSAPDDGCQQPKHVELPTEM